MAWLLRFTKGTLEVKFDILFLVLIVGIQREGWLADVDQNKINVIINEIEVPRDEVKKQKRARTH